MYPLFETICIKNGTIQNTEWHQMRYEKSYRAYYGKPPFNNITSDIHIPDFCQEGTFKMRISYNETSKKVEFEKYILTDIRTLKIVEDNTIEYGLKYTDRTHLNALGKKSERCDDILIVKNGMITDSSFCNIVFFDGFEWITPATPLLKGSARERLLTSGRIKEQHIRMIEINGFRSFKLINAMRDFESIKEMDIKNIFPQSKNCHIQPA